MQFGQEETGESEGGTGDEVLEQDDEDPNRRMPVPEPEPIPSPTPTPEKETNSPTSPGEPNAENEKITDYLFLTPSPRQSSPEPSPQGHSVHHNQRHRALKEACEKCGS